MTPCTIVRPQKNVLSPNTQKAKYVFLFTELNSIKNVIMLKKLRDHFNTLVCYLVNLRIRSGSKQLCTCGFHLHHEMLYNPSAGPGYRVLDLYR